MTPEGKVKLKVKKVLGDMGAYFTMPMGTGFSSYFFFRVAIILVVRG